MDKNFMNIDDLVRQRLGGGEEHEQAGSWGRMRDLLDKEMPQKKPAGIYWRRSLSAIALLLLVAGASVGGYEMMKNKNAAPGTTRGAIAAATVINNSDPSANNHLNNTNDTKTTSTNTNETKTINNIAATTTTAKDISGEAKPVAANVPVKEHKKHSSGVTATNTKTIAANNNKIAATNSADNNKEQHIAAINKKAAVKNTVPKAMAHEKSIAKGNDAAEALAAVADKNNNTGNNNSTPVATGKETMADMPLSSSAPSIAANKAVTVKHRAATGGNKKATLPTEKVAVKTNGDNTHKTPAIAANNTLVAEATEETLGSDNTTKTARKSSKHTMANKVAAVTTHTKPAAKVASAPVVPVLSATMGNTANNNTKTAVAKNTHKPQKQVQRLVLAQHMVRISPTQVKFILDTISMENATEDLEFAMAPDAFGPQAYEKFMSTTDETSEAVAVKDNHVKKSKGSSSLENLNAAFNDMKTKVKGAHFSPGITGGINGTFFGPNSFKGFQFGITGNMSFSETFAVQGELKYFNRISNSYSLNDNYYTYTPSAGGFTKTIVVNPYSINTLQSIEMPISVRYCTGNFNFYVGGNMAYSFAINSGAYPLADPSSATQVATVGNDNGPKVQTDDFNSRFGLGYLVGASCRVSPNVTIDFRNVQNIWDNSSTSGAKFVSSQLYKSPSLQLSIGYRFGGNKNKE